MSYRVHDVSLADEGRRKIQWALSHMPVLQSLTRQYEKSKPLEGVRVAGCLHVTKETAVLVESLKALGAELSWCGCNPLSTQDDVAASLAEDDKISIYASRGVSTQEYYDDIHMAMKIDPNITIDDGADLTLEMHREIQKFKSVYGGTEETTTGVVRLRSMEKGGILKYPIIAVNDAETKHDFDNYYGTGQSALDGIIRATNILISGKNVVICGYGHVGKGIARKAAGLGANVTITEVDPIAALKGKLDGFSVGKVSEVAPAGDLFITTTGCKDVIDYDIILRLKNGALLANAGHFNVEISVDALEKNAVAKNKINDHVYQYQLSNNKAVYLIAEGRLVNLAAAEGHPSEVMDMSFANQLLSVIRIAQTHNSLEPRVYEIERHQDMVIAEAKLHSMGIYIDQLTQHQQKYLKGFDQGT
ncbi:MAG: adenosylhomocysteinase [Nitrososphaeraceae archaeon]|nr:adenosylhomocysteinase [Nitrososphaeraceae archaeon]